jgi:hypothetical protein
MGDPRLDLDMRQVLTDAYAGAWDYKYQMINYFGYRERYQREIANRFHHFRFDNAETGTH